MCASTGRLLRRTSLKPDESFFSLITRLNDLNYIDSPWLLSQICRCPADYSPTSILFPSQVKSFEDLSKLTEISPESLYHATPHVFASIISPPHVNNPSLTLPDRNTVSLLPTVIGVKKLRSNNRSQFCPKCLQSDPYHHLAWFPPTVTTCLIHKCLLVDRCSNCNCSLTIQEIVQHTCAHCKTDLGNISTTHFSTDSVGYISQSVIQYWLGIFKPTAAQEHSWRIPKKSPRILFKVLSRLFNLISIKREVFKFDTRTMHDILAYAMQGVMNWPHGFLELIEDYITIQSPNEYSGRHPMENTYFRKIQCGWQHNEFDFVHSAFKRYLLMPNSLYYPGIISQYASEDKNFRDRYKLITCTDAARILKVQPATIKNLAKLKKLREFHKPNDTISLLRINLFDRDEIYALRDKWESTFTMNEVMQKLGTSKTTIIELAKLETLAVERGPTFDGSQIWLFSRKSVTEFLNRIEKAKPLSGKERMNMKKTLQILEPLGTKNAEVLNFTSKGILGCKFAAGKKGLRNLLFDGGDVRSLREELKAINGWLSRKEVAYQLGVKDSVLKRWVSNELIRPVNKRISVQYFNKQEIDIFYDTYIFCDEAAKIIGVGELVIQKWARNGRLRPVSGPRIDNCHRYLFLRSEVENLTPKKRRTAPQMARELGISRSQIIQWIKDGKIKPVSGPGIDKHRHYLFVK